MNTKEKEYQQYEKNELLIEMVSVQQIANEPLRRIFFAKEYQVLFWYENDTIIGLQIEYGGLDFNKVITAIEGKPISFNCVMPEIGNFPQSQILVENGFVNTPELLKVIN